MDQTNKAARVAGALYLAVIITGIFSLLYVPSKLYVRGNATATAGNVLAHETLFRSGIVVEMISTVFFIYVVMALYRLFSRVSTTQASHMAILAFISAAVGFMNILNKIAAFVLFRGADFLGVLDKPQRDALAMFFLRLHGQGSVINEIFWGLWLFPLGVLVIRSGFLPRILGVLLLVNGATWMVLSFTGVVLPAYSSAVERFATIPETGEMWFMLWLLVMGAKVKPVATALS